MRKIISVSVITILTAVSLYAQNAGDKVRIILKNGSEIHGIIKGIDKDTISLDLSMDFKSSLGLVGFNRGVIERIENISEYAGEKDEVSIEDIRAKLQEENQDAFKRREESRAADFARAEEDEKNVEAEKKKTEEGDVTKKVEEMTEWISLVKDFPPGEKWNDAKYLELKDQFVIIKVPPNFEEQRFVDNYDKWKKGVEYLENEKANMLKAGAGGESGKDAESQEEEKPAEEKENKEQGGANNMYNNPYLYQPYYTRTVAIILPCCYYTPCVKNDAGHNIRRNNERNIRRNVECRDPGFKYAFEPFAIPLFARNYQTR